MEINHANTQQPFPLNIGIKADEVNSSFEKYLQAKELQNKSGELIQLSEFSQYEPPITTSVVPSSVINIEQLYERITSDEHLRRKCLNLEKLDKESRRKTKKTVLEYITPSGTFFKRSNNELIKHSGYLCLDFDGLENVNIKALKETLSKDTELEPVLIFNSPSNNGIKVFVQIPQDKETHGNYFDAVKNYIRENYSLEVDKACRDVARACFLSYDKDAFIAAAWQRKILDQNFLDKWFTSTPQKKTVENNTSDTPVPIKINNTAAELKEKLISVNQLVKAIEESKTDITSDYKDWVKIGWALCELGEAGRELFHKISALYSKYDYDQTDEKYTSILQDYDGKVKLATLFYIAGEHGIKIPQQQTSTQIKAGSSPRTAKQRLQDAKQQAAITPLMGAIWQSGELHILFADTGSGKSVWATQIADALSKGKNTFTILSNGNKPLRVLFYDFELSDKQFQMRYSDESGQLYEFSDNLFIDNIDFQKLVEDNPTSKLDDLVINKIRADIETLNPDVLVIDNLTYLKTESTQDTSVALDLIRRLNQLKKEFNLSMLVLAHTPKMKEGTQLTVNELGGSKHLSNFVDSVSAIGKSSKGASIRYIKQVKPSRSSELVFDSSNVITVEMKKENRCLGFHYLDCEYESEHIQTVSTEQRNMEREQKKERVRELHSEGKSYREIEDLTGVSKTTIGTWLKGK
ncbi:MAG: BT4734/BF3469 family protein [Bacteroidota bacterium]|nr:BT4734/BF3469 family protein [Bacteroidota bacterium]